MVRFEDDQLDGGEKMVVKGVRGGKWPELCEIGFLIISHAVNFSS